MLGANTAKNDSSAHLTLGVSFMPRRIKKAKKKKSKKGRKNRSGPKEIPREVGMLKGGKHSSPGQLQREQGVRHYKNSPPVLCLTHRSLTEPFVILHLITTVCSNRLS